MKTRVVLYTFINSVCVLVCGHVVHGVEWPLDTAETQIVQRVIAECLERDAHACLAEKLARAVEHSLDWDIPLFDGITLKRNDAKMATDAATPRRLSAMDKLRDAVIRFIDAHTLTLDFAEAQARTVDDIALRGGGLGFGGGGGGGGGKKKISKRERRRVQYALFVLLGIFGLTVPLMLKTLGIMAGKALISSKVALIMLGSIALKKIFQADHHSPVKVHTHTIPIHDDDHDRHDYTGYNYYPSNKYHTKAPIHMA